jgi:hypothetical protein
MSGYCFLSEMLSFGNYGQGSECTNEYVVQVIYALFGGFWFPRVAVVLSEVWPCTVITLIWAETLSPLHYRALEMRSALQVYRQLLAQEKIKPELLSTPYSQPPI